MSQSADDYDSPWKTALVRYFPEFLAFYFPDAYRAIDWNHPHTFLEQELAQIVADAELGRRRVDGLVEIKLIDGEEQWVYIHVEIQGNRKHNFAERLFIYNYRLYDRYRRPIANHHLDRRVVQLLGVDRCLPYPGLLHQPREILRCHCTRSPRA